MSSPAAHPSANVATEAPKGSDTTPTNDDGIRKAPLPVQVRRPKQAVLIVHGMGEQRPMDTLRGFVRSIWESNPAVAAEADAGRAEVWSKPDPRTSSHELRRITTRAVESGSIRTDFYELYWADLTAGATWDQFTGWVRYLLFRRLRNVPVDVRPAWFCLWVITLLLVTIALAAALPEAIWAKFAPWWLPRWIVVLAVASVGAIIARTATANFGRVVRYTRADPSNIATRAAVRERGLKLLANLHASADYDRIVVVGHSLGTIVAYELISYFWSQNEAARTVHLGTPEFEALRAVEHCALLLSKHPPATTIHDYREKQAALRRLLAARPQGESVPENSPCVDGRWLISDFISIGSPLTHAEFLLASSLSDLARRKKERELPTAPPFREVLDVAAFRTAEEIGLVNSATTDGRAFSFPVASDLNAWRMHHGAAFAAVRWSNVYDPAKWIFFGDLISGPLASTLGNGIEDIDLRKVRGQSSAFSHSRYWERGGQRTQLERIREAVNLFDK